MGPQMTNDKYYGFSDGEAGIYLITDKFIANCIANPERATSHINRIIMGASLNQVDSIRLMSMVNELFTQENWK